MTDAEITKNLQPSSIAQRCPVCNGWGTVSFKQITCHACNGKGFILIPIEKDIKKDYE
ncbi:MAG: hypothetical protein Q7K55_05415 [Candidatus Levybacteria bacterium]|nr:hypothetical protein [Candidatus Levybacteria bacterium]